MQKAGLYIWGVLASFLGLFGASPAMAAGLTDLTDAVDFSEVSTAVLAIGVALAGVYVIWKGASLILRAIRGL